MRIQNIIEGEHNKERFRYDNGKLNVMGRAWDKEDIKTLVEIANLLEMQGYKLKVPTGRQSREVFDPFSFGGTRRVDIKVYDDEKEDNSNE